MASRGFTGSTPARFRLTSLISLAAIVATAVAALVAAQQLTEASDRVNESTGPVLVATQDVFASIAEADAASAAVFLSGTPEDREQRRLYELALERSSAQVQEVSRLVGDDDATHGSLKEISADLTTYSGLVEAARVANTQGVLGGPQTLTEAIGVVQEGIVPQVADITARTQERLDEDIDSGRTALLVAGLIGIIAIGILVAGQVLLTRRTNRLFNIPLVVATGLLIAMLVVLLSSWVRQQQALEDARDGGYDSIALTAEIQNTAFRYKTLESLALIATGDPAEQAALAEQLAAVDLGSEALIAEARVGNAAGDGLLLEANRAADSTREQAATAEMLTRWDRYLNTSQDIQLALDAGELATAVELATGPGNADFNGFNTSVESVLSDNRSQFTDGLADARNHLDLTPLLMLALPAAAAVFALWGYQLRIREYRR